MSGLEKFLFNKQNNFDQYPQDQIQENDLIINDILEKENYTFTEFDKDDELQQISEIEGERVKPWRKPSFQEQVNFYLTNKYKKNVTVSNRYAARIYRKMYEDNIQRNPEYGLMDKLSLHPDLTLFDSDYINMLRRKAFNYAMMVEVFLFFGIYYGYKQFNAMRTKKAMIFITVAPPISLFGTFYCINFLNQKKLRAIELDKKYLIN